MAAPLAAGSGGTGGDCLAFFDGTNGTLVGARLRFCAGLDRVEFRVVFLVDLDGSAVPPLLDLVPLVFFLEDVECRVVFVVDLDGLALPPSLGLDRLVFFLDDVESRVVFLVESRLLLLDLVELAVRTLLDLHRLFFFLGRAVVVDSVSNLY